MSHTRRCPHCEKATDNQWSMIAQEEVDYTITGICERGHLIDTEKKVRRGMHAIEYICECCRHAVLPGKWRQLEVVALS